MAITNPDAIQSLPIVGDTRCQDIQDQGLMGVISPLGCTSVSSLIGNCGCGDGLATLPPTPAPTTAPTTAPDTGDSFFGPPGSFPSW